MLFQSTAPMVTGRVFKEFQHAQDQARKNESVKRTDYYHSDQDQYTLEAMATWMSEPEKLRPLQINIVRKVVDKFSHGLLQTSQAYHRRHRQRPRAIRIQKASALDMTLKQASKFTKLLKTILLRPVWCNG